VKVDILKGFFFTGLLIKKKKMMVLSTSLEGKKWSSTCSHFAAMVHQAIACEVVLKAQQTFTNVSLLSIARNKATMQGPSQLAPFTQVSLESPLSLVVVIL